MTQLYPGNRPTIGSERRILFLLVVVFLPYLLFSQPIITSLNPASGPVGTSLTINGANFSPTPSSNIVWIGSVKASVTTATASKLTVTVPAGTNYTPVLVTTAGLTAASVLPFVTTFSDTAQFKPASFARTDYSTARGPLGIVSVDLDGDGKPDLATINGDDNVLSVYKNNCTPGATSFRSPLTWSFPNGSYPFAITAGDLDGDGKQDLVETDLFSGALNVFQNASTPGNIWMNLLTNLSLPSGNAQMTTIADLNGDGKPEIIIADEGNDQVSVYINTSTPGTISFAATSQSFPVPSGSGPSAVIATDLDGDGKPDIAAANYETNSVAILRNTSTGGTLSFTLSASSYPTGMAPLVLSVGDLDGDGKPDLITGNIGDSTLSILKNTSTTGLPSFDATIPVLTGPNPGGVVLTDLDGDGKPDIAVSAQSFHTLSVHRNNSGSAAISVAPNIDYTVGNGAYGLTAADLDGDGIPDLACVNNSDQNISILTSVVPSLPVITSFLPAHGPVGTTVTITGSNLNTATEVDFGGTPAASFTVVSPTTITATVGTGASGSVSVVTPAKTVSLPGFTLDVPVLSVTSFAPATGVSGTSILIHGTSFLGATGVSFGGTRATTFIVVSDTLLVAFVGTGASGNVSVTSPSLGTADMPGFVYGTPAPSNPVSTLTDFFPKTGSQGSTVTIKGTNLLSVTNVSFGGVPSTGIAYISDTAINVGVGFGATGDVVISGTKGADTATGFVFVTVQTTPPPQGSPLTLSSFSPQGAATGATVTIKGVFLSNTNSVNFGNVPAASFSIASDSVIYAVVGAGSTGTIKVSDPLSFAELNGFTFISNDNGGGGGGNGGDTTSIIDTSSGSSTPPPPPPLKFQLLHFGGSLVAANPLLQWQVSNDGSIFSYSVERGHDSTDFTDITSFPPSGSGSNRTYVYNDLLSDTGRNFYRLKMVDTNGISSYGPVISIQSSHKPPLIAIYPNPVIHGFTIADLPETPRTSRFLVLDMSGNILKKQIVPPGFHQTQVDLSGIPRGTYKLAWSDGINATSIIILIL